MGYTRKLNTGKWQARYRDPSGRERKQSLDSENLAKKFLERMSADIQRGEWHDPRLGQITVEKWIDQWWETTVNLRPSTRIRYELIVVNQILPTFGSMILKGVTPIHVRTWVAGLSAGGLAPSTVRKIHNVFRKIMSTAVDSGLILQSPFRGISLPKIEHKEMRFLTPEEVWHLADTIDPRYRGLVLLGAYGGLRAGEMAGLRTGRVDLMRGEVDIAEILVDLNGKVTFGQPKTRAGRRKVGLPRSIVDELATHIAGRKDPESDLVFQSPTGGPLRKSLFRTRFWLPAIEQAGLVPLRVHDLRHTAISFWIYAGAHVREITARAGHTSASVVLDRYGHILPQADVRLRETLEAMATSSRSSLPQAKEAEVIPIEGRQGRAGAT
ncbi:MAG: site-specific integrase [Actinobacteria bacterium]|nr:site-specific integrase [Actinomycetota bacterium]